MRGNSVVRKFRVWVPLSRYKAARRTDWSKSCSVSVYTFSNEIRDPKYNLTVINISPKLLA